MRVVTRFLEPAASAFGVAALAAIVIASGIAAPLERIAGDALVRAAAAVPPQPPSALPDVTLVALDPQSLRAIPRWPWPRHLYGDTIARLDAAGAKAIAFDIDFSTARDAADDAAFARAIAASGRVVLAAFRQTQELAGGAELEVANLPLPEFSAGAAALGSVLMPVAPDGVVRFAPRASSIAGSELPSLAESALRVALGEPAGVAGVADADGGSQRDAFAVDFRRAAPAIPVIPIIDVLEGRFDPRDVAGRVVLVGATAAEFQDLWATPLGPARPGVWIQAMTYRTLAAERAAAPVLRLAAVPARIALVFLLSAAAVILGQRSHGRRLAALALLAAGFVGTSGVLLVTRGVLVEPVVPLSVIATQYVLGLERVRRRFRRRLREREQSLSTLLRVGEASVAPTGGDGLGVALALLGDVVDASAVALLRATPEAGLDGRRMDWRRRGEGAIADAETAAAVLRERRVRVFEGDLPGRAQTGVAVYAPLYAGDTPAGVLVVERDGTAPLDATQLRTIATVGTQIALSAENLRLIAGLRATFDSSVEAIASAVEARDGYTQDHCRRLALFSTSMAARLGLSEQEIEGIRLGALLHDVGKIGIRDEILLKSGRFDAREMAEMQSHAAIGHRIISGVCGLLPTTLACVRHHHERWDGGGYPDGLRGEEIPLGARIVAVVDVWDALSTARPYKPAYDQTRVREILEKGRGAHFDPAVVDLFLQVLHEEGEEMLALVAGGGRSAPRTGA